MPNTVGSPTHSDVTSSSPSSSVHSGHEPNDKAQSSRKRNENTFESPLLLENNASHEKLYQESSPKRRKEDSFHDLNHMSTLPNPRDLNLSKQSLSNQAPFSPEAHPSSPFQSPYEIDRMYSFHYLQREVQLYKSMFEKSQQALAQANHQISVLVANQNKLLSMITQTHYGPPYP